ncbi:DUF4271 domain-containing protein [Pedobacter frigoris]|uniref:DUF4271 domain-containing protein n=1 Tax=Pedobacter frigoris TaxID=2571272 RepID=A0A4V5P1P1_9SPHI|nr:DUF4271 domain-containing protein [Pedobacter frigoris]TKC07428.1 DUF4271 domain-containing protein [Pedobacter frigoris]
MNLGRIAFLVYVLCLLGFDQAIAQVTVPPTDTIAVANPYRRRVVRDSAFLARQKFVTDSIMRHTWLFPDSVIDRGMIIDSIVRANTIGKSNLLMRYKDFGPRKLSKYQAGKPVPKGQLWVMGVVALLLILFAILKISFTKQLQTIVQSFFSNRVLNNLNKEDNLFTSWPFLLLFVQFGFTVGMFFYLVSQFYGIAFSGSGFQFYLSISILIVILYIFKIIILRLLGYLFNIQKPVNEYVTILYLSYFNLSLVFIPLVIAFALSPLKYGPYYIAISFVLLIMIFVFQFIRAGVNILSHHRFSKVYLFLYFCALEICPILILIKAIGL